MTFSIEDLNLSDAPIEGVEEAFANWQEPSEFPPPPPPGKHSAVIKDIRDAKEQDGVLKVVLDLELRGGEGDQKPLNFVRLSGKMFERQGTRTSQLLDFVKSAGMQQVPRSNKEFAAALKRLMDSAQTVNFQLDWRAYCSNCASTKLLELTGEQTDDAARDALNAMYSSDAAAAKKIRDEVSKVGTKAKNYKGFPEGHNGLRSDTFDCPACGQELRAQANITRWLRPST